MFQCNNSYHVELLCPFFPAQTAPQVIHGLFMKEKHGLSMKAGLERLIKTVKMKTPTTVSK